MKGIILAKGIYRNTVIVALFVLSGCASMSTMQTARTTPKNDYAIGFGVGQVNSDIGIGMDTISIAAPFLEGYGRYGVTERLDIGMKLTIIGTVSADVKYQFWGDRESVIAGSIGGGFGYMGITSGDTKSNIFDFILPTYFSVHPAKFFGIYVSPKYIFRLNNYSSENSKGHSNSSWYGLTGGLRIGKKTGFFAEYSYFKNSEISEPFSQVTLGVGIGLR